MWCGSGRWTSTDTRLVPQSPDPHLWGLSMSNNTLHHVIRWNVEKTAHQASRLWQNGALYGPPGTQRSTHGGGLPPSGKGRRDVSHQQESAPGAVVASASLDGQQTFGPCPLLFCRAVVDSHCVASAPRPQPCHRCGNPHRTPAGHSGGPGGVCQRGSAAGDDRAQPTAGGTLCCPRLTNPSTAVG